jgi:type IV pilus assembly protein PilW
MKRTNSRAACVAGAHSQKGLSLIELMVSLTIGLILMIAVISAYLGSAGAGRMAEAQGRMNEDANAALSILTQQLRMAGNNPVQPNYTSTPPRNPVYGTSTFAIRGCDGTFTNIAGPGASANIEGLTCTAGTATSPDSIAVSYEADRFNTVATGAGAPTDCLGTGLTVINANVPIMTGTATVATAVTYTVADNRYYVGTTTSNPIISLYCRGAGSNTPQPLVENVEDLQIMYGTSPATTATGTVTGYLDANDVETNAVLDAGTTPTSLAGLTDGSPARWARVVTARICIVVRSEALVAPTAVSARYTKCDGTPETNPPDLRLRRAYSTTVVLRNRLQ